MKKNSPRILCFFACAFVVFALSSCVRPQSSANYRLYIGTNDKDTYKIEKPLEEQKSTLLKIITKYTDGVTIYESDGYWKDEKDEITVEKTFVCEFFGIDPEILKKISSDVLTELNQNSVMCVQNNCKTVFLSQSNMTL